MLYRTAVATANPIATPLATVFAAAVAPANHRLPSISIAATLLIALSMAGAAHAGNVYIALGDSITFGETDLLYAPSLGDRGYVAGYADVLAARNGGVRPTVVNLAIDGETAASFLLGSGRTPPVVGRTDVPLAAENQHYNPAAPASQSQLFAATVAAQQAIGNRIDTITITLGFNELGALAALPTATALALIRPTLVNYQAQYSAVLTQVRSLAPGANLSLLGYFNPFPADPASPAAPIFNAAGAQLNDIIRKLAGRFGASFVDTAGPFIGHEAQYTYLDEMPANSAVGGAFGGVLPIGNVHPNALGYSVIAAQVAAVPEPAEWLLMALGGVALAASLRRRASALRVAAPAVGTVPAASVLSALSALPAPPVLQAKAA